MVDPASESNEPRRREIQRRLARAVAPNLLSYYRDALRILSASPQLENASHFVAHAMRDIESGVRRLLLSLLLSPQERQAVDEGGEKHPLQIRAILEKLGVGEEDRIRQIWLSVAGQGNVKALHGRAHRRDLRPAPPVDPEWWRELEELLEFQLDAIERHHTAFFPLLDELAAKERPTAGDITKVSNEIPNTYVMRRAFFEIRLKHPGWLDDLRAAGIFRRTGQEEVDFDARMGPLPWPETNYLARMATHPTAAPTVIEIALETQTDNEYVHHDFLQIALAVEPAALAIPLALREARWIGGRDDLWYPVFAERVADLVLRLAAIPEHDAPFNLAHELLEIRKAPVGSGQKGQRPRLLNGEPIAVRLNEYDYQRVIERITPAVVGLDPTRAYEMFALLLDGALRASRTTEEVDERDDHSTWWRRFVDTDEEGPRPYESALVTALLAAARAAIAQEPHGTETLLAGLEAHGWTIFQRVAIHLATEVGGKVARMRILSADLIDDDDASREYGELVQRRFGELGEADRQHFFELVQNGPDLSWLEVGRRAAYLRAWQLRLLRLVTPYLPAKLREVYPELGKTPEPTDPGLEHGHIWTGRAASPVTSATLLEDEVPDVLALLRKWQPKDGWGEATRADVGSELASAVASQPARFADHALAFQEVDPVYARSLFSGLEQALKDGRDFRWAPVLALVLWVAEQPSVREFDQTSPRWQQVHQQILHLLEEGLQPRESEIPFPERQRVWKVVDTLTVSSTIDEGLEKSDPMTASLSTTRGRVVHVTVLYSLWVRRHIERRPGDELPSAGFSEVPEARTLLEARLDPAVDQSVATRGAFGYRLTQLTYLDAGWVRGHLDELFPKAPEHRPLRRATRETYLAWSAVFSSVIELLADEYRDAFTSAASEVPAERSTQQAEEQLPERLALVYLRGHFPVDHPLLEDFFAKAPARMRAGFIEAIGRLLAHESTDEIHVGRARTFWDRRRAQLEQTATAGDKEAASFGFWFILERLPLEWRLKEMVGAANIALGAEPDGAVMETLARLAPERASETLAIAEVMALHPAERWQVDYWMPELRTVLAAARVSNDQATVARAKELVSKLVVAGHLGLSDLA